MQSIWNQSHISTNLCFWQMLSVHSKGSLHMNVDGVRAKMLGLKYQCLTFVCMGVRGLLTTNWRDWSEALWTTVSCALFSTFLWVLFLMSFLLAWLCVSCVCWIESGYSACVWAKCSCMLCKCFVFYFHSFIWWYCGTLKLDCISLFVFEYIVIKPYFYIVDLFIYKLYLLFLPLALLPFLIVWRF